MTHSALAFHQISSSGTRADQQSKAYALVKEFPYRTARELANKINDNVLSHDSLHKRLPELRTAGLLENPTKRVCTVTGKMAFTWAPKV